MDIYLIRHTEVAVGRTVSYGQSDVELATNYPEQRDRILAQLPTDKPAHLFSSPLNRCRLLANDLATNAEVDLQSVQFDDRIKELSFGDWEMTPWADIPRSSLDPWMEDFVNVGPPNGETFQELFERVGAFWQEKLSQNIWRDSRVQALLESMGWRVMVIWECETTDVEMRKFERRLLNTSIEAR